MAPATAMTDAASAGEAMPPDGEEVDQVEPVPQEGAGVYADWESVYRDNVVGIYQLAVRRVGNAADAEDLAQEVLIRTLKTLRLPAPVHNVRAYLVKTARTVLADHWRRHYGAQVAMSEFGLIPTEPLEAAPNGVASDRAQRLLALLPDRFNRILELRFLRGYSIREAAKEMGLTEVNARVLQFRALRKAAEFEQEVMR
jgi:RNA polymerase sigma factor (sigma-70 family)